MAAKRKAHELDEKNTTYVLFFFGGGGGGLKFRLELRIFVLDPLCVFPLFFPPSRWPISVRSFVFKFLVAKFFSDCRGGEKHKIDLSRGFTEPPLSGQELFRIRNENSYTVAECEILSTGNLVRFCEKNAANRRS